MAACRQPHSDREVCPECPDQWPCRDCHGSGYIGDVLDAELCPCGGDPRSQWMPDDA